MTYHPEPSWMAGPPEVFAPDLPESFHPLAPGLEVHLEAVTMDGGHPEEIELRLIGPLVPTGMARSVWTRWSDLADDLMGRVPRSVWAAAVVAGDDDPRHFDYQDWCPMAPRGAA